MASASGNNTNTTASNGTLSFLSSNQPQPISTSGSMTSSTRSDSTSLFTINGPTNSTNGTALPSVDPTGGPEVPSGVIALFVGLLVLGVAVFIVILYLRKTGKLYSMIPFKRLTRERRSSTSSSRRPLDMEPDGREQGDGDHTHMDDMPTPREGSMFTIDDADTEHVDLDSQSRGTNDEYFYDEVFGKSVFEDEVTNQSMRQLYLASEQDDDEMFDVDTIINSITGPKATATTAKTKT